MTTTSTPAPLPFLPDTPEAAFLPDPRLHGEELSVDAVLCACSRMRSVLLLLHADGQDTQHGFTLAHEIIIDALWLLEGQVEQLQALARAAGGIPHRGAE